MPPEQSTNNQRRAEARERARVEREKRQRREALKKILIRLGATVGALALLAAIGGGVWLATRPAGPGPANMASNGVLFTGGGGDIQVVKTEGVPAEAEATPTDTSKYSAPARIKTYIDFSCEYCKAFETTNSQQIKEMVASGAATLEVYPVAILGDYSVRAANAASCLAAYQPDSFLDASDAFYANQPAEGGAGWSNSEILDIWGKAGITPSDEVRSCVNDGRYADWVQAATEDVVSDPAIVNPATGRFGTPTVFVNDVRWEPTSLEDPAEFASFVTENSGPGAAAPQSP